MKSFGIVYLSFGATYVDCTIAALQSKIRNAPSTPATVLTNRKADLDSTLCKQGGIQLQYVDMPDIDVRQVKTQLYKYSPYEYTLLLDADAWINAELSIYFGMLDYTPIALTHAHHHPSIATAGHVGVDDRQYTLNSVNGQGYIPQYASGLVFFQRDNPRIQQLFDIWNTEWKRFRNKDQMALIRAIIQTQVFPLVLAGKHWLTDTQGKGFVSHRFTTKLPSMPRKDAHSPRKYTCLP